MANGAITIIVNELALVTIDSTATASFQDDVMFELARGMWPGVLPQAGAAYVAVVGEQTTYTLPVAAFARIPIAVFYDSRQLFPVRKDEAWMFDAEWRQSPGSRPVAVIYDPEDRTNFSLVPAPKVSGDTIGGSTPFQAPFVPHNIMVISSDADTAFAGTTYDDLKLPIALEVIAKELARDSNHHDDMAAGVAHKLALFFFNLTVPPGVPT